jgi:hypothetical protein
MFNRAAGFHGGALLLRAATLQWRGSGWYDAAQSPNPQTVRTSQRNKFRARAPVKACTQRGESPRQAKRSLACNRRLLRRGNTGWRAAGGEQPVRNNVT